MKYIRQIGQSFTEFEGKKIGRGASIGVSVNDENRVDSADLPSEILHTAHLILKRYASELNKVIRAPNSLKFFNIGGYKDRVVLAEALWPLVQKRLSQKRFPDDPGLSNETIQELQNHWQSLVYAFAQKNISPENWKNDENIELLNKYKKQRDKNNEKLRINNWYGSEYDRFVKEKESIRNKGSIVGNAEEIAKRIDRHISEQALLKPDTPVKRLDKESKTESKIGRFEQTAESIALSANDPRQKIEDRKALPVDEKVLNFYFRGDDLAAEIHESFLKQVGEDESSRLKKRPSKISGEILFHHFGAGKDKVSILTEDQPSQLFHLHRRVTEYYNNLTKSERFLRAWREGDAEHLKILLPENDPKLKEILDAKNRGREINRLLRLGKAMIYASDFVGTDFADKDEANLSERFHESMERYVTSKGLTEIKRNESLVMEWRKAVSLSHYSLRMWADPDNNAEYEHHNGIISTDLLGDHQVRRELFQYPAHERWIKHCGIIFGNKQHDGQSRVSLFNSNDQIDHNLRGFIHLASKVRMQTNHYNSAERLIKCFQDDFLWADDKDLENPGCAHSNALAAFKGLLEFDKKLDKQALIDQLIQIEYCHYVGSEQTGTLSEHFQPYSGSLPISVPGFSKTIRAAQNAYDYLDERKTLIATKDKLSALKTLKMDNHSRTIPGAQQFRIKLLEILYQRGFRSWLAYIKKDTLKDLIKHAVKLKNDHLQNNLDEQKREFKIEFVQSKIAQTAVTEHDWDLQSLFRELSKFETESERHQRNKKAKAKNQKEKANWLEDFKRILFALLFSHYLKDKEFAWIFTREKSKSTNQKTKEQQQDILAKDLAKAHLCIDIETESWSEQFYAWLYLLSLDQVSLLNQRIDSTLVSLEDKDDKNRETLCQMMQLMSLFLRVYSAGFDGTELVDHVDEFANSVYENTGSFTKVFSVDHQHHDISMPGTRVGLRKFVRFGGKKVLDSIFDKHKITDTEVNNFTTVSREMKNGKTKADDTSQEIRQRILEINAEKAKTKAERERKKKQMQYSCTEYRRAVIKQNNHLRLTRAARLNDHIDTHQLLLKIVARLLSFTIHWERDRDALLLGMLYEKLGGNSAKIIRKDITINGNNGKALCWGFALDDAQQAAIREIAPKGERQRIKFSEETVGELDFLPVWSKSKAFILPFFIDFYKYCGDENLKKFFCSHFIRSETNPKDETANERLEEELKNKDKEGQVRNLQSKEKAAIRNDLAHYNVLSGSPKQSNLVLHYLIDAVRSLMSYDRKMHKAVSKSMKDLLLKEGFDLQFDIKDGRLSNPRIQTNLATHLNFGGVPIDKRFLEPMRSARMTSMVQALFQFDKSGLKGKYPKAIEDLKEITNSKTTNSNDAKTQKTPRIPSEFL